MYFFHAFINNETSLQLPNQHNLLTFAKKIQDELT